MKNAGDIKQMLAAQAEAVASMLLPSGKRQGAEWCAGSTRGEAGSSLKVHLVGNKAGVWCDFSTQEGGDLLDLWAAVRGVEFVQALKQAKDYLGVRDADEGRAFTRPAQQKNFVKPDTTAIVKLDPSGPVAAYLVNKRGISVEVLRRYRQAQTNGVNGPECVFPVCSSDGKTVEMLKHLAVKRGEDGKKIIRASKDSRPHLFGWQAIDGKARHVVITEGEIDAMTVAEWGFPALSVPSGVQNMDWVEHDFNALARFDRIYIATDNDEPGDKCAEQIAARLGRERCFRVVIPGFKDANEALMSGKFCGPDFEDAIAKAKTLDPAELRNAGEYSATLWEELFPTNPETTGTETPWAIPWRIRPGELTIWTGWNGHGKSHLLNQVMLHDAKQGQRCLIASFEMPVAQSLAQMSAMSMGHRPKSKAEVDAVIQFLAPHFWFYDVVGVKPWRDFLPSFGYAVRRYGITRIVVDSLLRVGVAEDDYEGQKVFVSALVNFAAEYQVHVHLVAHSRKQDDESKPPGKMDIRGGAAITDLAHNGFSVWRNKAKEHALAKGKDEGRMPSAEAVQKNDMSLACWKNRKTGVEPFRRLWLNPASMQFVDNEAGMSLVYLKPPTQPANP